MSKENNNILGEVLAVTPPPRGRGWGRGLESRIFLFPGSFDPFTRGHADLVRRGLTLCERLIVAVGYNERKPGWMPVEERVEAIRRIYRDEPRVTVESYTGLTADLARERGASAILRGVRTVTDYEYELQMADLNRRLTGIETILLPASPELACISSSAVRELSHFGRDVSDLLPA